MCPLEPFHNLPVCQRETLPVSPVEFAVAEWWDLIVDYPVAFVDLFFYMELVSGSMKGREFWVTQIAHSVLSKLLRKIPLTVFWDLAFQANLVVASLGLLRSSTLTMVLLPMVLELSQILLVSLHPLRVSEPFEPQAY